MNNQGNTVTQKEIDKSPETNVKEDGFKWQRIEDCSHEETQQDRRKLRQFSELKSTINK